MIEVDGVQMAAGEGVSGNTNVFGVLECLNVDAENCITVLIYDVIGDGICCSNGEGHYDILSDGEIIYHSDGQYGIYDQVKIQYGAVIPNGQECAAVNTACMKLMINPDSYPAETSYRITSDSNLLLASGRGSAGVVATFGELTCLNVAADTC